MTLSKNKIFLSMAGLVFGVFLTLSAGFLFYRVNLQAKRPRRVDARRFVTSENSYELEKGVRVFAASSLDRIFQDGWTLIKPSFAKSAVVSLARNEYESFQIVVTAGESRLRRVRLETADLVREDGEAKIDRRNISWRVVGYVPTIEPYYPVKYVGPWPDPLLKRELANIEPQTTQPFWVTIYAAKDTAPGVYHGALTLNIDDKKVQKIPVSVRVYDFDIPRESSLKTAFDFYGHETHVRYPQKVNETDEAYRNRIDVINQRYLFTMLLYRMNPVLNLDPTNSGQMALVDRLMAWGLNNFSVGKRGGTLGNNWPQDHAGIEALLRQYRTYGEILKLNKLLPFTYIYAWDEGDIGNPLVPMICSMIHRAYRGLKTMVCYHGFWDPDKHPAWGKDIDIWCFQIDKFDEEKMRRLQDMGKEIWMYISGPGGMGSPNLAMDFDSIDYRIVPWLCWKYDIKGFLYWCVNWWTKTDPFKSAANTRWEQNANGLLFYPGAIGPVVSLRLEIFRDGMEDYEYIQALMARLKVIKKKNPEGPFQTFFDESIKLLTVDETIASSMFNFTKDNGVLTNRRDAIARKIEEFDRLTENVDNR